MTANETLKLIRMNEVQAEEIKWLWYPYIPFGKITVIQGDPGDGKTTMVLAIAAAITTGAALFVTTASNEKMTPIQLTHIGRREKNNVTFLDIHYTTKEGAFSFRNHGKNSGRMGKTIPRLRNYINF